MRHFYLCRLGLIPAHAGKTRAVRPVPLGYWAHPRSRGENRPRFQRESHAGGSSPLTRGKHPDVRAGRRRSGLIPAHAGKTVERTHLPARRPAHPRSRGENTSLRTRCPSLVGSSPLTRGKHSRRPVETIGEGLIPAHAGKTRPRFSGRLTPWAHPRSRGENSQWSSLLCFGAGSSPLTRGKLHFAATQRASRGLIPAHAGKTRHQRRRGKSHWAHPRSRGENVERLPRVPARGGLIPAHAGKTREAPEHSDVRRAHPRSRGENSPNQGYEAKVQGSSPLTRGKRDTRVGQAVEVRLIPAHAGKTPSISSQARPTTAHPRSRGENLEPFDHNTHGGGSSPLTRGKRNSGGERVGGCGLIPAHAGKTDNSVNLQVNTQAHPRSRGENAPHAHPAAPSTGSSPLTRGKRTDSCPSGRTPWLIPAHAGKTFRGTLKLHCDRAHPRSRGEN